MWKWWVDEKWTWSLKYPEIYEVFTITIRTCMTQSTSPITLIIHYFSVPPRLKIPTAMLESPLTAYYYTPAVHFIRRVLLGEPMNSSCQSNCSYPKGKCVNGSCQCEVCIYSWRSPGSYIYGRLWSSSLVKGIYIYILHLSNKQVLTCIDVKVNNQ